MTLISFKLLSLLDIIVDWFECIQSPMNTCRNILDLAVLDKEKIKYTFRIWVAAFLLSFCLELPIYIYYGTRNEYSFYIIYVVIGFFYFIISSYFVHLILLLFRIKSNYVETLIIYTFVVVAYSPFILLLSYNNIFIKFQTLMIIKNEHIDILNNLTRLKDIIGSLSGPTSFDILIKISNLFSMIVQCITGVLLAYLVMERYNCNKYKSFIAISCIQITMIFPLILPIFIKELILYIYLK